MNSEFLKKESIFKQLLRRRMILLVVTGVLLIAAVFSAVFFYQKARRSRAAAQIDCLGSGSSRVCTFHCTTADACYWTYNGSNYEDANIVVTGANANMVVYGHHRFASLTIKNGGTVTHDYLNSGTDYDTTNWTLTPRGKTIMVDLEITAVLRFETGGKIDVSGKGYQGGDPHYGDASYNNCSQGNNKGCGTGDGPGGGRNVDAYNAWGTVGAGGGYGGKGGDGHGNGTYYGGAAYGDLSGSAPTIWHGSGGGSARLFDYGYYDWRYIRGSRGGGAVKLIVGDIQTDSNSDSGIFANGDNSPVFGCGDPVCGGAGSGGSIYLALRNLSSLVNFSLYVQPGWTSNENRRGTQGQVATRGYTVPLTPTYLIIRSKGGDGGPDQWGQVIYPSGGGGRILIDVVSANNMKKWLEPISRLGSPDFNPYALKVNDRIKVNIFAAELSAGTIIEDSIFWNGAAGSGSYKCIPDSFSPADGSLIGDKVTWTYNGSSASATFSYYCNLKNQ